MGDIMSLWDVPGFTEKWKQNVNNVKKYDTKTMSGYEYYAVLFTDINELWKPVISKRAYDVHYYIAEALMRTHQLYELLSDARSKSIVVTSSTNKDLLAVGMQHAEAVIRCIKVISRNAGTLSMDTRRLLLFLLSKNMFHSTVHELFMSLFKMMHNDNMSAIYGNISYVIEDYDSSYKMLMLAFEVAGGLTENVTNTIR